MGLIVLYGVGEFFGRRRFLPFFIIFWASLLATLVNPYGTQYWGYLAVAVLKPRPFITEWTSLVQFIWRSPDIPMITCLGLLPFLCFYGMYRSRRLETTSVLVLLVLILMAVKHMRHLIFALLVIGAYLPDTLAGTLEYLESWPWLNKLGGKIYVRRAVLATFLILTTLLSYRFIKAEPFSIKFPSEPVAGFPFCRHFPEKAVDFIRRHDLKGNLLSEFGWGEYLIWNLYPRCRVAFDGRYETVYPEEVEQKYWQFYYAGPQWRSFLESYPPDLILVRPQTKIARLLEKDPEWVKIYEDRGCVLFTKRSTHTAKLELTPTILPE
ncbi:MAG: hypothetical protein JRI59_03140 [Deltaproteobacteria bacterium]|nr:hypothetical protein [Deltaproteobacteria bacterium]